MNELPDDLAHPRREHASTIASLVTGAVLLGILGGIVWFAVGAGGW